MTTFKLKPIRTEADYVAAVQRANELMEMNLPDDSPLRDEMEILAVLIGEWEREWERVHHPVKLTEQEVPSVVMEAVKRLADRDERYTLKETMKKKAEIIQDLFEELGQFIDNLTPEQVEKVSEDVAAIAPLALKTHGMLVEPAKGKSDSLKNNGGGFGWMQRMQAEREKYNEQYSKLKKQG